MICNRFQIREVSGVRQFVVVDDLVSLVEGEDVADEIGTDKSGAAGYKDFHRPVSFGATSCDSRSWDILFAPVSATRVLARSSDSNVPASVHQPSRTS